MVVGPLCFAGVICSDFVSMAGYFILGVALIALMLGVILVVMAVCSLAKAGESTNEQQQFNEQLDASPETVLPVGDATVPAYMVYADRNPQEPLVINYTSLEVPTSEKPQ